ncbi:MAG: hypothetical protein AB7N76_12365 [Planctomycetota bacterium]
MTDASLRELERRWIEGGDPEAEARYLSAALRAGEQERPRLELASYLGHEPATLALGGGAPRVPEDPIDWALGIQQRGGIEALRRLALAAAWLSLPESGPDRKRRQRAWRGSRSFVLCPCAQHWWALGDMSNLCSKRHICSLINPKRHPSLVPVATPWDCAGVIESCFAARPAAPGPLAALSAQVSPWALGRADPLRAGWASEVARLDRAALASLVESIQTEGLACDAHQVLDPDFPDYASTMPPHEAADRALAFVTGDGPRPVWTIRYVLERYEDAARMRGGVCAEFEPFFAGGWREVYGMPPDPVPPFDPLEFNF